MADRSLPPGHLCGENSAFPSHKIRGFLALERDRVHHSRLFCRQDNRLLPQACATLQSYPSVEEQRLLLERRELQVASPRAGGRRFGFVSRAFFIWFSTLREHTGVQPHIPTSVALARLLNEAPQYVSLGWLFGRLQKRSFGFVMLLLALVGLLPGVGIFIGILLAFPAVQMILGYEAPSIPHLLTTRRIATRHIALLATRTIPLR
jgi:Exopolysaccharide synthesis, ExoD